MVFVTMPQPATDGEMQTWMWMAIRSLRVKSNEYTSARPPMPMRKVTGSAAVVTDELQVHTSAAMMLCQVYLHT